MRVILQHALGDEHSGHVTGGAEEKARSHGFVCFLSNLVIQIRPILRGGGRGVEKAEEQRGVQESNEKTEAGG